MAQKELQRVTHFTKAARESSELRRDLWRTGVPLVAHYHLTEGNDVPFLIGECADMRYRIIILYFSRD
jgi:hypothetical protein